MTLENSMYKFISIPYVIDRKLYKYYSNTKYATDSIKNRRIHLDNPREFNDPFEAAFCCYHYTRQPITDTMKRIVSKVHKYVARSFGNPKQNEILSAMILYVINKDWQQEEMITVSSAVEKIYNCFGEVSFTFDEFCDLIDQGFLMVDPFLHVECKISCFSEIKDSILMWSYYAHSHEGVCVEYDLSKLDPNNALNQQIISSLSKVHYSPIRADNLHMGQDDNSYLNFLTSKSDVWSHEHEWRIICESDEEYLPLDCISTIYVGAKFKTDSVKYRNLIKAADTYKSIKIFKCKLNSEEYKIDFEEIYDSAYSQLFNQNRNILLNTKRPVEEIV